MIYDKNSIISSQITNRAVMVYLFALVVVNVLFSNNAMMIYWWVFGITEVLTFFLIANRLSKTWNIARMPERSFIKRVFLIALILRLLYIAIVLPFNNWQCEDLFGYEDADPTFYDDVAKNVAQWMRDGNLNPIEYLRQHYGLGTNERHALQFSDAGFPLYLSFVYLISNDSIVFSRILHCIFSAWTVILIYKLAARNFGDGPARIAAILCMLMPNLIYYCATGLKEVEMVFLTILFVERGDFILRQGKFSLLPVLGLIFIAFLTFTFRTVLGAVLILAFLTTLLFTSSRVIGWGRRVLVSIIAVAFIGIMLLQNASISNDVRSVVEERGSGQKENMEWRATRKDSKGNIQQFAKYAGAAVFAPMIFTIPFPTMVDIPDQEQLLMIHGGNYCKNITSFFTVLALFMLLFSGNWRKHILPVAMLCGYLVVLVFSRFAQSERFHQPILALALMFAAYGIYQTQIGTPIKGSIGNRATYKRWFSVWLFAMFVAAIVWNWFKLAGRGLA